MLLSLFSFSQLFDWHPIVRCMSLLASCPGRFIACPGPSSHRAVHTEYLEVYLQKCTERLQFHLSESFRCTSLRSRLPYPRLSPPLPKVSPLRRGKAIVLHNISLRTFTPFSTSFYTTPCNEWRLWGTGRSCQRGDYRNWKYFRTRGKLRESATQIREGEKERERERTVKRHKIYTSLLFLNF